MNTTSDNKRKRERGRRREKEGVKKKREREEELRQAKGARKMESEIHKTHFRRALGCLASSQGEEVAEEEEGRQETRQAYKLLQFRRVD